MSPTATHPLQGPLLRGNRRPRVVLVGRFGAGKSTIFEAASSPVVRHEHLAGLGGAYQECIVDVGLHQISLVDLPSIDSLHRLSPQDQVVLMYLLWGDRWPEVAPREAAQPDSDFPAPDVLVQVADAMALERDLELSLELSMLGRPMVIALNRVDEARRKGLYIDVHRLGERLGVPVIPTVAHMGKGISALFETIVELAQEKSCPLPQPPARHIADSLQTLQTVIARPEIETIFRVPRALLLSQLAENDDYFLRAIGKHFPGLHDEITRARGIAETTLPRPLSEEVHADRHHRAAVLHEAVSRARGVDHGHAWWHWLDRLFLHRRWGLVGSLLVFTAVLLIVLHISTLIDGLTSARLAEWVQQWQPDSTPGVVGRAVADGMVGLVGIVLPYMLPLVLLLVTLEESGVMHRVAFVVDRGFHRIGLHGGVAVPFLMGLGCNVPAISAAAISGSHRERIVAAILITFVPCSARSAILLAIGGKFLGGFGVVAIFTLTLVTIAALGKLMAWRFADSAPGMVQAIPPYSLPNWSTVWRKTWSRTEDIVTVVTPLLVVGSVVLALLTHVGADAVINTLLTPITAWWLGLPDVLGVPILFGVLRKELSMLMIQQALGSTDIAHALDQVQIFTFLVFLTFYVPCLSTFAVTCKSLGRKVAWFSASVSLVSALVLSGLVRLILEVARYLH